jgi:hypothetical protein
MSFQSIHIPLSGGQNESIDKKILPDGSFRSVRNMRIQRRGRMSRSYGSNEHSVGSDGEEPAGFLPNGEGVIVRNGDGTHHAGAWRGDGEFFAFDGRLASDTYVSHLFSDWDNSESSFQSSPEATTDASGRIIMAFVTNGGVVIEVRDQALTLLKTIQFDFAGANRTMVSVKIAGSSVSDTVACIFSCEENVNFGNGGMIGMRIFETSGYYNQLFEATVYEDVAADPNHMFDISARPGRDTFLVTYDDGVESRLQERAFSTGALIVERTKATGKMCSCFATRLYAVWSCGTALSVSVEATDWGFLGPKVPLSTTTQKDWAAEYFTATGFAGGAFGPVAFDGEDGEVVYVYPRLPTDNDTVSDGFSAIYTHTWNIDTGESTMNSFMTDVPVTGPSFFNGATGSSFRVATEPVLISDEDLLTEYEVGGVVGVIEFDGVGYSPVLSAVLARGGSTSMTASKNLDNSYSQFGSLFARKTLPRATSAVVDGRQVVIYPIEFTRLDTPKFGEFDTIGNDTTKPALASAWCIVGTGPRLSSQLRANESVVQGGALSAFDGQRLLSQFTAPPKVISNNINEYGVGEKNFMYSLLFEYVDSNNRLWRSAPSAIRSRLEDTTFRLGVKKYLISMPLAMPAQELGARLVMYTSEDGILPITRKLSWGVSPGGFIDLGDPSWGAHTGSPLNEILYTQLGDLPNSIPPPCRVIARGRNRMFAGHLEKPHVVQASKILNENEGVAWSTIDSFTVALPGPVTGLVQMDDGMVAFTNEQVLVIHGTGPDNTGVGSFAEPQVIPCEAGCSEPASVIQCGPGIFFLSRRGIELLGRGYQSPEWVGRPVMDVLEEYPVCLGATYSAYDSSVRWLFVDSVSSQTKAVVIVFCTDTGAWIVCDCDPTSASVGQAKIEGPRFALARAGGVVDVDTDSEAKLPHMASIETGDIRVSGIQGWAFGRRVHVLGDWSGVSCGIKIEMAFDGNDYIPDDQYTWSITDADFTPGPVELELTLPVQKFSAVRFRLTIVPTSTDGSVTLTGLTLFYNSASDGPRLGERGKG